MKNIFFLLVLAILVSGCAVTQREVYEQQEPEVIVVVNESAEEPVPPADEEPVISCEEWAQSLFPEQWVFQQDVSQDPKLTKNPLSLREGVWADGTTIGGLSSTMVEKGSEAGENINYYYARPIFISVQEYGYTYSRTVIDKEGNILGTNSFKINPVFKVIHDTVKNEENAFGHPIKVRYLSLVIKEPNTVDCVKAY